MMFFRIFSSEKKRREISLQDFENWKDQGSNESFTLCGFLHQVARGPWLGFGEMPLAGVFWETQRMGEAANWCNMHGEIPTRKTKIDLLKTMFIFFPSLEFSLLLLGISGAMLVFFRGRWYRTEPPVVNHQIKRPKTSTWVSAETWTRPQLVLLMADIPFSNCFGMVFFQAL